MFANVLQHSLVRECFEDTLPSNASLMCSPFFGQGVLQECGKHISDSHLTHLKLKQQLLGQNDNFFFTVHVTLLVDNWSEVM